MKQEPFVLERTLNAPIEIVWKAITDKDEMKKWYFDIQSFRPEVGFEFAFEGTNEGKTFLHLCKITEVVRNKKLSYSWRYEGYTGISLLTFELSPEGEKTNLKLTHEGLETFPQNLPDFARKNFVAGWNYIIDKSIQEYLEKIDISDQATTNESIL
jgi:uncharacterized protein YndB with AHSA1/START domain